MVVLIVCLVLIAVALIALGVLVVDLLGRMSAFGREVARAQSTMQQVDAVLAELPRRRPPSPAASES